MTTKDDALRLALDLLESMYEMMPDPPVSNAIKMCREALAQKDGQQPVAWMFTSKYRGNEWFFTRYQSELTVYKADKVKPLYAAPPKSQPLPDEKIIRIMQDEINVNYNCWADHIAFCRAVEQATA